MSSQPSLLFFKKTTFLLVEGGGGRTWIAKRPAFVKTVNRQPEIILKKPGQTLRFFKFSVSLAPFTYIEKLVANWLWMRTFLWKDWAMLFLTSSTSSDWKRFIKKELKKKINNNLRENKLDFCITFLLLWQYVCF